MAYKFDLGTGQQVYLDNQGQQTIVTTTSSSPGQLQQASSSFETGTWTAPPQAFLAFGGVVLKLQTAQGERLIQIQGSTMSVVSGAAPVDTAESLPSQQVESPKVMSPMQPMKSMEPMQPMTMGNMSMNSQPMEMQMGNMEMRMGAPINASTASSAGPATQHFCTQCGTAVKLNDRFCSNCGTRLEQ